MFPRHFPKLPPPQPVAIVRNIEQYQNLDIQNYSKAEVINFDKDEIGKSRRLLSLYKQTLHLSPKLKAMGLGVMLGDVSIQTVPKGLIQETNFTARSLAYWIMDDGGKMDYGPNEGKGVLLHTQAFSEEEVVYLCEGLQDKFDLQCWPKKNKGRYCVAISGKCYDPLMKIIDEHIIPSMRHRLPNPRRKKS